MTRCNVRRCIAAATATAFALLPIQHADAAPRVFTVIIDKMKFGALPTGIRIGDTILWVNKDMFKHTATARDNSFSLDLPPKTSGKTLIKHSGPIQFYCIYHPGMKGALTVVR
jgi:plastocyanin